MSTPTVLIVCGARGCSRVLATLDAFPPDGHSRWTDPRYPVWVAACHRHGGVAGTIQQVDAERMQSGRPQLDRSRLMHAVSMAELREAVTESTTRGRPARIRVSPL